MTPSRPHARAAAVGMFDGVHLGHRLMVGQVCNAARIRGLMPTIFTFSIHPLELVAPERAPRLLTLPDERCRLLCEAGAEQVIVMDFTPDLRNLSAADFLQFLKREYDVEYLVVGFNHHFGRDRQGSFDDYRRMGREIGVEVVRSHEEVVDGLDMPVSSSSIRTLLSEGDVATASRLLGREYAMPGTVVHGKGLGHTIGFPTANLEPLSPRLLVPGRGVYAAWAIEGDSKFPAIVNIGNRPTVDSPDADLSIEAHLIDFDGDLYGRQLSLRFVSRLRSEQHFPSVEALRTRLVADRTVALSILRK